MSNPQLNQVEDTNDRFFTQLPVHITSQELEDKDDPYDSDYDVDDDGCEVRSSDGSDTEGSLRDFIVSDDEEDSSEEEKHTKRKKVYEDDDIEAEKNGDMDWIKPDNVVGGKRERKPPVRYVDKDFVHLMNKGNKEEEIIVVEKAPNEEVEFYDSSDCSSSSCNDNESDDDYSPSDDESE